MAKVDGVKKSQKGRALPLPTDQRITVELPTKGLGYDDIPGTLTVSPLRGGQQEMLAAAKPDSDTFQSIIGESAGLTAQQVGQLYLGDFQFLVIQVFALTYSSEFSVQAQCPHCGASQVVKLRVDQIPTKESVGEFSQSLSYTMHYSDGQTIDVTMKRLTLGGMRESKKLRQHRAKKGSVQENLALLRGESSDSASSAAVDVPKPLELLAYVIESVNGDSSFSYDELLGWLKSLPAGYTDKLLLYYNAQIEGVGSEIPTECTACGEEFPVSVEFDQEFFRRLRAGGGSA